MKIRAVIGVFLIFLLINIVHAQEDELDPGVLPDSPWHFLDKLFEIVGDDPEKALEYREEKIAEALAMAKKGKDDLAREALMKAGIYSDILEREVTPQMEVVIKKRSLLIERAFDKILEDVPELEDEIQEHIRKGQKINLAAEVATKIKDLCEALSELDPLKYEETCKTYGSSPEWHKDLDKKLTKDQKEHAKLFAKKLRVCFETPENCDCEGMGVKSFEEICIRESGREAQCRDGNEEACDSSNDIEFNPEDYLPDYLVPIIMDMMRKAEKEMSDKFDRMMPPECREAGAESPDECRRVMTQMHMPPECKEKGAETREECEKIMMDLRMPPECKEAGATTREACEKIMRNLEREFHEDYRDRGRGPPPRIQEFGRDCHAVADLEEKARCFEEFYNKAQDHMEHDYDEKDYEEHYEGAEYEEHDYVEGEDYYPEDKEGYPEGDYVEEEHDYYPGDEYHPEEGYEEHDYVEEPYYDEEPYVEGIIHEDYAGATDEEEIYHEYDGTENTESYVGETTEEHTDEFFPEPGESFDQNDGETITGSFVRWIWIF